MENSELITKAVEYAKNHCRDEISVQEVADHAGFSLDYFNRIFLRHTGFTVMAYINYIRLKKAAYLLRDSKKSVLDIAIESGYDSHEGFAKAFKKRYGMSPSEYRKAKKNSAIFSADLADDSVAARFLYDNPTLQAIDTDFAIDALLEKDMKRYAYFCTNVKFEGLRIAAPDGNIDNGVIGIGDNGFGGYYCIIHCDDFDKAAEWIKKFNVLQFCTPIEPETVKKELQARNSDIIIESFKPQSFYYGDPVSVTLPDGITVRKLTCDDMDEIRRIKDAFPKGYAAHLLHPPYYGDPTFLDYGVFKNGELIAAAGCVIDKIRGMTINDSCRIRFAKTGMGKPDDELCKQVYLYILNDLLERELLPFDDSQHGDYARDNGGFTAGDIGFTTVCYAYFPKISKKDLQ